MYEVLGLSRGPFAAVCDGPLYWESDERKAARCAVLSSLRSGRGVWLSGPPGSGRSTLMSRVAEDAAQEGLAVLWSEPEAGCAPEDFLGAVHEIMDETPPPRELPSLAESLYSRLIEGFSEAGTIVCFPGLEQTTVGTLAEAAILSRFRVAGRPLVALALFGGGDPPFPGLEKVSLSAPSRADLEACLRHRASLCGDPDVLSADALEAISMASKGFGDAVRRAGRALASKVFRAALAPPALARLEPPKDLDVGHSVLDPAQLDELSSLLESLSPRH